MSNDINALNSTIDSLVSAVNTIHTDIASAVQEILAKNSVSPTPVDYTDQVNKINAALQQVKNDTTSIDNVIAPAPVATPVIPNGPAPVTVPLPDSTSPTNTSTDVSTAAPSTPTATVPAESTTPVEQTPPAAE